MDDVAVWRRRSRAMRITVGSVALVGVLLVSGSALPPAGSSEPLRSGVTVAPALDGRCLGALVPVNYSGILSLKGGGLSLSSVANVSVELSYFYELDFTPRSGNTSYSCLRANSSASTNASGALHLTAPILTDSCVAGSCVAYRGPFAPESVGIPAGAPSGYFVTSQITGDWISLAYVAALASVELNPAGSVAVSVLAATPVRVTASAGDGSPTPATVRYDWRLDGAGWDLLNGSGTSSVNLEALSANSATLAIWVNGTFRGTPVSAGPAVLGLSAYATEVTSAGIAPTALDAGSLATFNVTGTGATGYPYSATFAPGLGVPADRVPCGTAPISVEVVSVTCAATLAYSSPGEATPSVSLTNEYSDQAWTYPAVTVDPRPTVTISPDPLVSYVATDSTLTIRVDPGSGTPPFGPVCVWIALDSASCQSTGTNGWSFPVNRSTTGTFPVRASVVDSAGSNQTATGQMEVALRPSVNPPVPSRAIIAMGSFVTLTDRVSGGAPPIAFWWNDSLPNGTLASGAVPESGYVNLTYLAYHPGVHLVTLTARDALGTSVAAQAIVKVLPGPASALVDASAPFNGSAVAGAPFAISWTALDASRERLSSFAEGVTVARTVADVAIPDLWVNASSTSADLTSADPSAMLNASAWVSGYLNLTLASNTAGGLELAVTSPVPVLDAPKGSLHLFVSADALREQLSDPVVAHAGDRINATAWRIADRFGNAIPDGYVVIRTLFGSTVSDVISPIHFRGTTATVWVNYSAPDGGAGTVYVLSMYDQELLGPIPIPPAPSSMTWFLVGLLTATGTLIVGSVALIRYRRRRTIARTPPEASEAELRRLAEGRAHVLAQASAIRPKTDAELAEGLDVTPIASTSEVREWVTGLVADGSLEATTDSEGTVRFLQTVEVPDSDPVLRIDVNPAVFDSALARRSDVLPPGETEPPGPLDE